MDQTLKDLVSREQAHRILLEKAAQQLPTAPFGQVVPVEASFYFPWEHSPFRTNGSTSAETA